MKTIAAFAMTILSLLFCQSMSAQDDYSFYLQKARQRLAEGDCGLAQQNYNVYKELTKKTDALLEKEISDCWAINGVLEPIDPFAISYYFRKESLDVNSKENKEAKAVLSEKLAAGGIIRGFRLEVWVGPDAKLPPEVYANAVENDIRFMLKKFGMNSDSFMFESNMHEVDWDTFLFFVESSDIKDKYAIMNELNNTNDREATLETLLGVFPQFETEIMPLLRRVIVYVY